jgi:hypothetical protein
MQGVPPTTETDGEVADHAAKYQECDWIFHLLMANVRVTIFSKQAKRGFGKYVSTHLLSVPFVSFRVATASRS